MTGGFASMSAAVVAVLDGYPAGHRFHGNQLKDDVARIHPESGGQYVDTILRMARRHRRGDFRVVDRNRSLYEKTRARPVREPAPAPSPALTDDRGDAQIPLFGRDRGAAP